MTEPVGVALCEEPATRSEFVTAIGNRWHRIYRDTLSIADLLFIAKKRLDPNDFKNMVLHDLPFSMDTAYRIMRIAADPKLAAVDDRQILPRGMNTLDILRRLSDSDFLDGVQTGHIHDEMTEQDARDYLKGLRKAIRHRPIATARLHAPAEHVGPARTWPEIVWLLAQRRKELGISQLELDQRIGWGDTLTSKLEIPHEDDGRFVSPKTLEEWMQALSCGVRIVAL